MSRHYQGGSVTRPSAIPRVERTRKNGGRRRHPSYGGSSSEEGDSKEGYSPREPRSRAGKRNVLVVF